MRIRCAVVLGFVILLGAASWSVTASQAPTAGTGALVGTWRLVALERAEGSEPLASVPNPIGILIQDARGNVIEIVTRAGRAASIDVVEQFMTYQAFWGTYAPDAGRSMVTYRINGDLDPGRTGQQVMRSYERKGNQLVLTQSASAVAPASRTTWTRVAELEALPDYQHDAVGFWQWVSAGLVNASGAVAQPASRDASVIVYTPTGLMAVLYLPPPGRKPFAGARPTVEEARAALQGAPTYFGPYIVQPKSGSVTHYQIAIPNPGATGNSLLRNFEVRGSELILTFPPTTLKGEQVRNVIHLKRLGGLADMWPEFRR
jgi:lipocalin-like protein